ncbi:MAG TPA: cytochrome bc complex cytochrome b subunit [Steroidobacteraceae bacterium]
MAHDTYSAKPGFWGWLNRRLPVDAFVKSQVTEYYAPKNFNFWYFFGSLALLVLVMQLVTGIFLTMFYKVGEANAFDSVEYIMREVNYGWLLRYLHSTGASAFFLVIYLHMFRGIMYGSYKSPRELLWLFGMIIYLVLMAEAFMGYVLPWGNMSFWAATVIINLFGAIPVIGPGLVEWIRGDYGIADATLNRFFSLHVVALPLLLLLLVVLHLVALHEVGSNNPDGVEIKEKKNSQGIPLDGIPFHPYYTVKDLFGTGVFLTLFAIVVFFVPTFGDLFLEKANFEPANPLSTPDPISPSWYFTPYYAILRSFPDKATGAVFMLIAVSAFFFLPWLDRSPVKSIRYRGWIYRSFLAGFVISFVGLMYLGLQPAQGIYVTLSRVCCVPYFAFFLLMPWYSRWDPVKPVPERVTFHA